MPVFGLIHYNYPGSLEKFLDFAAGSGFECTELLWPDVWDAHESFTAATKRAEKVRAMLDSRGMRAAALAPGNDFLVTDQATMQAQVERMRRIAELAQIVGAPVLRIDGGNPKPDIPVERYVELIATGICRCCEFTTEMGLRMALDNHGMVTNDADRQVAILQRVGDKSVGANIDTMNYRWAGHDLDTVRRYYATIAPWVIHTHFKDGIGSRAQYVGTALGEGEMPLEYAVEQLQAAGYSGPYMVEYEGKTDHDACFRKGLRWLQEHIG